MQLNCTKLIDFLDGSLLWPLLARDTTGSPSTTRLGAVESIMEMQISMAELAVENILSLLEVPSANVVSNLCQTQHLCRINLSHCVIVKGASDCAEASSG